MLEEILEFVVKLAEEYIDDDESLELFVESLVSEFEMREYLDVNAMMNIDSSRIHEALDSLYSAYDEDE